MTIHRMRGTDNLSSVAREYGTFASKLLEDNGLNTDRVAKGEELLILSPTRYLSVRGGEKISDIAKRFGVCEKDIYLNNPATVQAES
jgi:LysM repeat protein